MKFKIGDRVLARADHMIFEGVVVDVSANYNWPYRVGDGHTIHWYAEKELTMDVKLSDEAANTFREILNNI